MNKWINSHWFVIEVKLSMEYTLYDILKLRLHIFLIT